MGEMGSAWPQVVLVATLFGLVVLVLWLVLPFAVFGIKPLLRQIAAEQKAQTALMARMADQLERAADARAAQHHRPPG